MASFNITNKYIYGVTIYKIYNINFIYILVHKEHFNSHQGIQG